MATELVHWNSYKNILFTESSVIGIFMASHYYLIELYLGYNIDTIIENHIYYNI